MPLLTTKPYPITSDTRWRFRFTLLTLFATVLLIAWGAFVTSISAGLAVPDWPTSFGSWNQLNPWPEWWSLTPVLAEHGHRLLGALVGFLTMILAFWTWRADPRRWMQRLAFGALALVIFQGLLGGLRVVWVSLDLAVVHACFAQLFFATIAAMAVFTSRTWLAADSVPPKETPVDAFRKAMTAIVSVLFLQILLGALLRHPGAGIDFTLAMFHIGGAAAATILIGYATWLAERRLAQISNLKIGIRVVMSILAVQLVLGSFAYFVLLDSGGRLQPSNFQVIVNSGHVVVGALLFGSSVATLLFASRQNGGESAVSAPNLFERPPLREAVNN